MKKGNVKALLPILVFIVFYLGLGLIFEYALFKRPMIFFAYDLDDYNDWRGFYYDYGDMTPGPVVRTSAELADYLGNLDARFDAAEVAAFRKKFMSACDGHATERICQLVVG